MTSLEKTITKVALMAARKAYGDIPAQQVWDIAEATTEILVEMIVCQEKDGTTTPVSIPTQTYADFEKMNEYLDEVARSFPIINAVEVTITATMVTRTERTAYRNRVPVKRVKANLTENDCG